MVAINHFTCLSYNTIDFLIHSKYVLFGIHLPDKVNDAHITFENEVLPHINLGPFLEEHFVCKSIHDCNIMLVMKKNDFDTSLQKKIVHYTGTDFPASGTFALSVNSDIATKEIDLSILKLIPKGIREKQKKCGVHAIGFAKQRMILITPDNLIRTVIGVNS
ncbi:MAG: hypothetical protein K6E51_01040 [Treponema sp.]|nr:hypothetical protein [Treponema sp.]